MVQVFIFDDAHGTTLVEAYSCNVQVIESIDMQEDPKAMSLKDWIIAQCQDTALSEIKYLTNKISLRGIRYIFMTHKT